MPILFGKGILIVLWLAQRLYSFIISADKLVLPIFHAHWPLNQLIDWYSVLIESFDWSKITMKFQWYIVHVKTPNFIQIALKNLNGRIVMNRSWLRWSGAFVSSLAIHTNESNNTNAHINKSERSQKNIVHSLTSQIKTIYNIICIQLIKVY